MRQPSNSGWCVGITIITENLRGLYCPVLEKEWENGERTQMYFWNELFHPRMVFKCRDPFLLSFFSYNIVIVFERCLLCWMPVKLFLSNWTMKKCFCPSMIHTFWSEPMYYGTPWIPDYRCWIPVLVIGTRILDSNRYWDSGFLELYSGFQSPGFRVPRAKIVWIPISTKGRFWNHRRPHTTITLRCKPNQSNFSDATTCDALRCKGRSAFIQPFRMPVKQR